MEHYTPPKTKWEVLLSEVILKYLSVKQISITTNLISYGLDSLTIMSIITEVNERGLALSFSDFYEYKTIQQMINNRNKKHVGIDCISA